MLIHILEPKTEYDFRLAYAHSYPRTIRDTAAILCFGPSPFPLSHIWSRIIAELGMDGYGWIPESALRNDTKLYDIAGEDLSPLPHCEDLMSQDGHDLGKPWETAVLVIQLCTSYICGRVYPHLRQSSIKKKEK
jgi:hypothetical protein